MQSRLTLARFAFKNVWRRRLRASLTLAGIAMGIAAFVALVGFSRSYEKSWMDLYESAGTDIAVVQKTFMNTSVDDTAGPILLKLPEVQAISPMIVNMMDVTPENNAIIYGLRADSFEFAPLKLVQGERFHDGAQEIMLGKLLADGLHKSAGDTLEIQGTPFKITGVYQGGSALEAGAVIMPLGELQKLSSLDGKVTAFHVKLRAAAGLSPEEHMHRGQAAIEGALPGLRAVPAAERASNNQLVVLAHAAAWGTSLIALLVGALGIANTMAMSVFERTKEIGVLRSLGWAGSSIMSLILVESAGLGILGGLVGVLAGWVTLCVLAALPQTANVVSSSLPLITALEAVAIAVFVGLAAGFVPAFRASRLSPVEAMRHE